MLEAVWDRHVRAALEQLAIGAFLTTAHGGKVNTMTIGWGTIGVIWSKPIFTVHVRRSRHTHEVLDASGEFTVSIPLVDMSEALALCGSRSGREGDKLAAAGLEPQPARMVRPPVIAGAGLHYECRVVYRQDLLPADLDPQARAACYANGDYHTQYFGEIVAFYRD